ncbi:MAG TPA: hypothetical protein DER56_06270 [Thermosipho africanus]|nr:hypothetical protein [Thermosipho africanus]
MKYKLERGLIGKLNGNSHINVMLDKKSGEVFASEQSDGNSWTVYNDENIIFCFKNNPLYGYKWTKKEVLEKLNEMQY